MHQPPEPHVQLTIPSIHDDTTLDCRIYHPDVLSKPQAQAYGIEVPWRKRGIVMAHPYAPLGGSYDDRVVGIVVEEFLALGYVVGTFNFRGAQGSKGRTSWSGKPEVDDYISFAALFIHYLSHIRPHPAADASFGPMLSSPAGSPSSTSSTHTDEVPTVVLGGYSHGSLIVQHLPPAPSILQPFAAPPQGSAAHEIILRARKLADRSNLEWMNLAHDYERQRRKRHHEHQFPVVVGGEETSPDQRRSSRELRRSVDKRRNIELGHALRNLGHKKNRNETSAAHTTITAPIEAENTVQMPHVRYLLISPLTGPVSLLAAPGLHKFWHRHSDNQEVVGKHISLILYGDQDIFSSATKVRAWAEKLASEPGSQLTHVEVHGAGHFWHEHGVEKELRSSLRNWGAGIWDGARAASHV